MTPLFCVGCGRQLFDWDGSALAYTCSCGATTFAVIDPMKAEGKDEELVRLLMPRSFYMYVNGQRDDIPHLEYYVGTSNAVNPLKTLLKRKLKEVGAISRDDCVICKARKTIPA